VLAHERIGDGAPLLLVHGLGHRRQAWYPVVDLLAPHREVILVDLPATVSRPPMLRGVVRRATTSVPSSRRSMPSSVSIAPTSRATRWAA
jgi:pimeloyl-ACP methyl ester carboxylesterase